MAAAGGGIGLEAFEARVLALTNEFRIANGKDPFANDTKLNAAAEDWSRSMATGDFFRHSTPAQVEEQGYDWRAWGENIAAGYTTPEAVVNGWINSPGHRANMLSDNFEEMGVGYYYLANDTGSLNYRHYWTQTFGTEAVGLRSSPDPGADQATLRPAPSRRSSRPASTSVPPGSAAPRAAAARSRSPSISPTEPRNCAQ